MFNVKLKIRNRTWSSSCGKSVKTRTDVLSKTRKDLTVLLSPKRKRKREKTAMYFAAEACPEA